MTVTEWLRLLNRKVFFWPTEERVDQLLRGRLYRDRPHLILVIDTASLLAAHEPSITIAPINTGATLYDPPPRGTDTLLPIAKYPFQYWRSKRTPRKAIAELAVDYAVPDILSHVIRVERRQHGLSKEIVLTTEPEDRPALGTHSDPDAVAMDRTVLVLDAQTGTLHTWTIVRPEQRDAASGRLSIESPIAKALLDHKPGDVVTAETPRGPRQFEIRELLA